MPSRAVGGGIQVKPMASPVRRPGHQCGWAMLRAIFSTSLPMKADVARPKRLLAG